MRLLAASFILFLAALPAGGFELELPLDCPDSGCFVQQYVDMEPGPGAVDYACGSLTYPGHKGTDFRVSPEAMRRGVKVRASAPGTVVGVRDGMEDVSVKVLGEAALKGRKAGNGVRIDHGGGWFTQYSHMKKGSIRVRTGDKVEAGQVLGEVGLSGFTEFPHVHLGVSANGTDMDPFSGNPFEGGCGQGPGPLWSLKARPKLGYRPHGLVDAGFSDSAPQVGTLRTEGGLSGPFPATAPAMVYWALVYGVKTGDIQEIALLGPKGEMLARTAEKVERGRNFTMRYVGAKNKTGTFAPGTYTGRYALYRQIHGELTKLVENTSTTQVPATADVKR